MRGFGGIFAWSDFWTSLSLWTFTAVVYELNPAKKAPCLRGMEKIEGASSRRSSYLRIQGPVNRYAFLDMNLCTLDFCHQIFFDNFTSTSCRL